MIVDDERDGVWAWALTGLAYLVGAVLTVVIAVGTVVAMVVAAMKKTPAGGQVPDPPDRAGRRMFVLSDGGSTEIDRTP